MPIHISYSLINDYLSCRRKAYYRINKHETSVQDESMIIGDIVHRVLEKAWQTREDAMSFADKEMSFRGITNSNSQKEIKEFIDTFFDKFRPHVSENDLIEKKFKIPLMDDVFVVGKMDRISNGSVFDWKTERNPPKDVSKGIQFILYRWAYKSLYKSEPHGVYYASLKNGNLIRYRHDVFYERILFDDVIPDIISAIKSNKYVPDGILRKTCFKCSYARTCLKELGKDVLDSSTFDSE